MGIISNIVPTTELEAINAMLAAIGEAALPSDTDLSTVTQADVEMALNILRDTTRETLSMGWRFNTEDGVEIQPVATFAWTDSSGVTTTLNIFKKPADALGFTLTACAQNGDLDLIERRAKAYQENGAAPLVLYDRTRNRDGAEQSRYPSVYLDVTRAVDFEDMPEEARRYCAMVAARRLVEQAVGSDALTQFSTKNELAALRLLTRKQRLLRDANIFNTMETHAVFGGRPHVDGPLGRRVFPGRA